MQQIVWYTKGLLKALNQVDTTRLMLVTDRSYCHLSLKSFVDSLGLDLVVFDQITPNPLYEQVCVAVDLFKRKHCTAILAIGGGSTIDVAKCIKLFCKLDPTVNYLQQSYADSGVPLIAVPTTAGTGSEGTRFAVIYYQGAKQSVTHPSIVPTYAVLIPSVLETLPNYQKKCTLLDALCQAIESLWSVNSTPESAVLSELAIVDIMGNYSRYLTDCDPEAAADIMGAANTAGRAIDLTQTTAPHAMSYKLTSLYRLPHGHAVALCLPGVWRYMLSHTNECVDPRGSIHLVLAMQHAATAMGCSSSTAAIARFEALMAELGMERPTSHDREAELDLLAQSVNPVRLKNNPVPLSTSTLRAIYNSILL
ncbi:MAG: phosphonoacetaldehyde reductase [Bacteroidales bacterium]|nr:phosphonoacetaldehyde reductase [Bacteroidales bacterium]